MTIASIMSPFTTFINALRSMTFTLGGITLSFWDMIGWCMFAGIVIWFIAQLRE